MATAIDIVKRLFKLAEAKRLNYEKVKEETENAEVIRDAVMGYVEREVGNALDAISDALEDLETLSDLGLAVSDDDLARLRALVTEMAEILPDEESMPFIVDTWDALSEAVADVGEHKENPREFSADEKQAAREDTTRCLKEFAEALDNITVTEQEAGQ